MDLKPLCFLGALGRLVWRHVMCYMCCRSSLRHGAHCQLGCVWTPLDPRGAPPLGTALLARAAHVVRAWGASPVLCLSAAAPLAPAQLPWSATPKFQPPTLLTMVSDASAAVASCAPLAEPHQADCGTPGVCRVMPTSDAGAQPHLAPLQQLERACGIGQPTRATAIAE